MLECAVQLVCLRCFHKLAYVHHRPAISFLEIARFFPGFDDRATTFVPRNQRKSRQVFVAINVQVGAANACRRNLDHNLIRFTTRIGDAIN